MKGRKVSDETASTVRELRRQGLSLRQIARRARTSKSTVYRLTKGISWEQDSVQDIETEKIVTGDGTEWASRRAVTLQVPRTKMEAADMDRSWIDELQAYYTQTRPTSPLRSRNGVQEQHVPLTVQSREESELDQAETYIRQVPIAAEVYRYLDTMNIKDAIRSEDPLRTYSELRRKALVPAVKALLLNKTRHFQTP